MSDNNGYLKTFLIIGIALILVIIIGSLLYVWKTQNQNPIQTIKKVVNDIIVSISGGSDDPKAPKDDVPPIGPTSAGGGGGGSGSGGSGNSGGTSNNCTYLPITYSLINNKEVSKCNLYNGEVCIDKTVNCSIEIENREGALQARLTLRLTFVEKGKNVSVDGFDSDERNFILDPKEIKLFEGTTNIVSSGIDGLANKEITCYFNTIGTPYKEICP
jgi:hypothetical protein